MTEEVNALLRNQLKVGLSVNKTYAERHEYFQTLENSDHILLLCTNIGPSGVQIEGLIPGVNVVIMLDFIWSALQKFSGDQFVFLKRDLGIIEQISICISGNKIRRLFARNDDYEFKHLHHSKGFIGFFGQSFSDCNPREISYESNI